MDEEVTVKVCVSYADQSLDPDFEYGLQMRTGFALVERSAGAFQVLLSNS